MLRTTPLALALLVACAGKAPPPESPPLQASLAPAKTGDPVLDDQCRNAIAEKDKYIGQLEAEVDASRRAREELQRVLDIARNAPKTGPTPPKAIDTSKVAAASKAFHDQVGKAQDAIASCYREAKGRDQSLDKRVVALKLHVTFDTSGAYDNVILTPHIDALFDQCIAKVASAWTIPKGSATSMLADLTLR